MQVHVRPLFACDASQLRPATEADGGARVIVNPDATILSVYDTLFHGPVRIVDRHGVCPPLNWPFWLLSALNGDEAEHIFYFVNVIKMRAVKNTEDKDMRMTVIVRGMHLFHTPTYASTVRWIVDETIRPLVLPNQIITRVHKDCVCDDKNEWTMSEWLATFPRAEEDALDVVITHEDERCVIAHSGDVVFCLPHDRAATSTTASPVVMSRKRKA